MDGLIVNTLFGAASAFGAAFLSVLGKKVPALQKTDITKTKELEKIGPGTVVVKTLPSAGVTAVTGSGKALTKEYGWNW